MEPRWRILRAIGRWTGGTLLIVGPASAYVAHKYRPRASFDKEFHENSVSWHCNYRRMLYTTLDVQSFNIRDIKHILHLCPIHLVYDLQYTLDRQPNNPVEKLLLQFARQFSVLTTANLMHWLLKSTQRVDMVEIDKLHRYIDNE